MGEVKFTRKSRFRLANRFAKTDESGVSIDSMKHVSLFVLRFLKRPTCNSCSLRAVDKWVRSWNPFGWWIFIWNHWQLMEFAGPFVQLLDQTPPSLAATDHPKCRLKPS